MIIDYDHNPALTTDQKLQSLVENILLAFGETMDLLSKQQKQFEKSEKKIDALLTALGGVTDDITDIKGNISTIQGNITTIQGDITTMQSDITSLQTIAEDAILQGATS